MPRRNTQSLVVVTRNYRDRKSKQPWLMRGYNDEIERCVPHAGVVAKKVTFEGSNQSELGFGCAIVAVAETAEGFAADAMPTVEVGNGITVTPLRFCQAGWLAWFEDEQGNQVQACEALVLMPDGSMTAHLLNA
jgi:hypothetical protein